MLNSCAATNSKYFIGHNRFTGNGDLSETLFWKDKCIQVRKSLRQIEIDYINDIRHQRIQRQTKFNVEKWFRNNNSGLNLDFCNINRLSEEESKKEFFLK